MFKKTVFIICLFMIFSSIVIADDIPELFWTDPELVPPMTGEEIKDKYWTDKPFEKYELYRTENPDFPMPNGKLLVVVNNTLYSSIQTSISNYISKVESFGYTVTLWTCQYGDPVDMRTELQDFYDDEGYFTIFIIGDFPPAISEIGYFSGENTPYPIDLFLMDLDGVWTDSDNDGYYDQHTGETTPEIALGRLWASNLNYGSHTEAQLINDYFTKNLDYYNGGMSEINRRGLAFVDDDWDYLANMWGGDVGLAYDDMTIISDRDTTCDTVYEDYLTNNYESILLCCHSNPNLHHFKINSGWDGYTWYYDIYNIEPTAIFFNLFCCSNAQYTYNDCMGSWYVLNPSEYCLGAIGSAKTGSMLYFDHFYNHLGDGEIYGEAFRAWFEWVINNTNPNDYKPWHYGMTFLGDPILKISEHQTDIELVMFNTQFKNDGVHILWDIETEDEIYGYNIYKKELIEKTSGSFDIYEDSSPLKNWEKVNEELITGASPFEFIDNNIEMETRYQYKLHAVIPGTEEFLGQGEVLTTEPTSYSITSIYPNPVDERLNVELSGFESHLVDVFIYDITGRIVKRNTLSKTIDNSITLDTTALSTGMYQLVVSSDEGKAQARFVVAR